MTNFYSLRFETPPTWRARSPYLYPPGTGWPGFTPRHWVLFKTESEFESESYVTTVWSRPVFLGLKHPSGVYDQIFIKVRQFRGCCRGALSLTRGWVCHLQWLLGLVSAVILLSESCGTRDHILLSQIRDFPFRRLLLLVGIRWRYSTLPPHGIL
jgi:hypothetical protein